ncbi:YALIA101S01e13410g1_1 [Yarrowia lipolytica]|nr:Putative enoyl-CoA hydratase [Yarrowia lipolytica]SEI31038.1 YALIA101S01e13410g1_1 [Yarrowia lipolytica]VBB85529.1 Enoyl-CoA hydratase [Yarrowia lipolytica]
MLRTIRSSSRLGVRAMSTAATRRAAQIGFHTRVPTVVTKAPTLRMQTTPFSSSAPAQTFGDKKYEHILTSTPVPKVALVTLNRPKALNALCTPLIKELNEALQAADADPTIGAIVLTGSEKSFAAGADIKEMKDKTVTSVLNENFIEEWGNMANIKKPIIAAVNGFALGGGCELAMMADIIYAGAKAKFGQPEIKLGVIPGAGGTQRLTRAIGLYRANHYILTGEMFTAQQAADWGLAAKVYEPAQLVDESVKAAAQIASYGQLAVQAAKASVHQSAEVGLRAGLEFERVRFHGLFGTHDQKEGMAAFAEKREPNFKNE